MNAQAAPPAAPPPAAPAPGAAPPPPAGEPPPAGLTAQPAPPPVYAQPVYAQPYAGQPGAYPVAYAPVAPPPPRRPRARKGLMIGGIAALGASYIIAVVSGAVLLDIKESTCRNCSDVGRVLFIPLAGPFLGMAHTDNGDAPLVLLGVFQIAGTGLLAGGIVQYVLSKRRAEQEAGYGLDLGKGRKLAFDLHASQARVVPSVRLRF